MEFRIKYSYQTLWRIHLLNPPPVTFLLVKDWQNSLQKPNWHTVNTSVQNLRSCMTFPMTSALFLIVFKPLNLKLPTQKQQPSELASTLMSIKQRRLKSTKLAASKSATSNKGQRFYPLRKYYQYILRHREKEDSASFCNLRPVKCIQNKHTV